MKKILFLILIGFSITAKAQVCIRGIVKEPDKKIKPGDTLIFCGAFENQKDKKLYYRLENSDKMLPASNISLLYDESDFWQLQQFYYTSNHIVNNGWQLARRKQLEQETLNYIAKLEAESKILHDKLAEDYLQQMVQKIHDPKIWKGRDQFLSIKILNSDQKVCYAFDNGIILISSQIIAETINEEELFFILTEAVAHILLDSNLDNIESSSDSELQKLGAIYSSYTKKRIRLIAERFLNQYKSNNRPAVFSNVRLTHSVSGVIGYTAWQEYYSSHYQKALDLISRLEENNIANSTDFLLKAKIFMKISNSPEDNDKIVGYLRKAASFTDQELPEIYSELGIALIREEKYEEARQYFLKYYELVLKMNDDEKMKWALKMINLCNAHLKPADTQTENN